MKSIKAEQRVVMALQLLMSELGNPELKGKGKEIVNNLNVNISNPALKQHLQMAAAIGGGAVPHKPLANSNSGMPSKGAGSSKDNKYVADLPPRAAAIGARPDVIYTGQDAYEKSHTRMVSESSMGTPFASDSRKANVFSGKDNDNYSPRGKQKDSLGSAAFGGPNKIPDLFVGTPRLTREES